MVSKWCSASDLWKLLIYKKFFEALWVSKEIFCYYKETQGAFLQCSILPSLFLTLLVQGLSESTKRPALWRIRELTQENAE